jgi:zinc protease
MTPTITVNEVNDHIRKWLADENTFTLVMAPGREDMKLPTEKELLAMTQQGLRQEVTKTEETKIAADLMPTKPVPGKVVARVKEDGFDATTYTLSNGIKITIKPTTFKSDEILVNGIKKGGLNNYDIADRSNVQFATDLVDAMGVGEFTPADMDKVTAGKNMRVSLGIGEINDNVSACSTVKDFESMLQLMNLYLASPRKDQGLFSAYKEKQMAMIEFQGANPKVAFFDTTIKSLYNNNPLASMVVPKAADYDNINLDRSLEIYRNEFSYADGYHFFIAGNIDPETAIPLLETYLGSLPAKNKPVTFRDNGLRPVTGTKEIKIMKGKEKQSLILAVYGGEITYSEDLSLKTQAVAEVLNLKVIEELREKMGKIYGGGFQGMLTKEPYQHYSVQLQLPCGPENVEPLLAAAGKEIQALKEKGPDAKDLDKVKTQWKQQYITSQKENGYWTGKMEHVLFWGGDKDRSLQFTNYIDKLTPADIQETAKKLFKENNQFISVMYPES